MVLVSVARYRSGRTDGVPEKLIYHLKHRDEQRVFAYGARQLLMPIREALAEMGVRESLTDGEIVISYPPRRREALRKEGFDQAQRLGRELSRISGWPLQVLLDRTEGKSREQKRLNAEARLENALGAYELSEKAPSVHNKTVILLDDLYTTGATLRTCAQLVLGAGAARVILATLGRTDGDIKGESEGALWFPFGNKL